ncbi:hypothetical protein D1AOALGA4SA_9035 [Olavius algarvensis Delta 1 endosymbiont]|nr:hypothetical protein D1AOALGA4SA_9035 [Olavius algarvensis Delta 1 endosymbiont]
MYEMLDAHFLSVVIVVGSIMVTPIYVMATYVFSGASARKGWQIGCVFLLWGAFMFWVCLSEMPRKLGLAGNLIVPVAWLVPSLILYWRKDWFLSLELSQKWLVGLQIFRLIGGVFLIEMAMGHIPGIFAYPAGIGDLLVGTVAIAVLLANRDNDRIPGKIIMVVVIFGMADFLNAFFFGFFSSPVPVQIFFPAIENRNIYFPTGMIPLFLVPYAIFFHFLSLFNYLKFQRSKPEGPEQ